MFIQHQEVQSVLILLQRLVCPITAFPLSVFWFWLVLTRVFFLFFALCCLLQHCVIYIIITSTPGKDKKFLFFPGNPLKCGRSSRGLTNKAIKGILEFTSTDLFFSFKLPSRCPLVAAEDLTLWPRELLPNIWRHSGEADGFDLPGSSSHVKKTQNKTHTFHCLSQVIFLSWFFFLYVYVFYYPRPWSCRSLPASSE